MKLEDKIKLAMSKKDGPWYFSDFCRLFDADLDKVVLACGQLMKKGIIKVGLSEREGTP